MNRNKTTTMSSQYLRQQETIKETCRELNLIAFYPNYHADKTDCNTVLIYTKADHEYNKTLPEWASNNEYRTYVCGFENTDLNGRFDLNFMNRGRLDLRGLNDKETIKNYIAEMLEKYNNK